MSTPRPEKRSPGEDYPGTTDAPSEQDPKEHPGSGEAPNPSETKTP